MTIMRNDKQKEDTFFSFPLNCCGWDMAKACTLLWEDQNSKRFKVSDFFILKKEKNIQFKLVHLLLHDINGEWKPQDLMGLLWISTPVAYSLDASRSQSKSKYTKTNTQIQIQKYKYGNTNTQLQIQ